MHELKKHPGVACILVQEFAGPDRTRPLARAGHEGLLAPVEHELAGTPCQQVSSGERSLVASGLRERHPQDELARELSSRAT